MEHAPNVPVVVLSGQDDEALAIKAVHQGVQDYLIKGNISSQASGTIHSLRGGAASTSARAGDDAKTADWISRISFSLTFRTNLRTPLTCIHQYVTLLLDGLAGAVAPDQADHLKTVLKSVNQLHAMIRDLLEATRAESGENAD